MAVIRCPNCGKPNPDFLEVCQYCDAKLHTADGAPADSRAPSSADDTLIRPPAPRAPTPEPEPEADATPPSDWMDRLRQMQSGEAAPPAAHTPADEPDWMWTGTLREPAEHKPASAAPTPPAADSSAADLPEWLRDLDEPLDLSAAAPKSAGPFDSTDRGRLLQLPITHYPLHLPPPASPVTHYPLPITSAVPPEPSPFEPTASDVTIPPRSRRKLTDWLNKLQELPPPTPPAEPEAPVIPNTDADLPDWLKAMAAEAETPGSATPAVEAATQHLAQPPSAAPTPEDELPDWLRALRAKTEPPRPAPGTAALQNRPPAGPGSLAARRNQELPEKMRPPAADETLIPRPGARPLDAASDDMPDWLKGILSPSAANDPGAASEHPVNLTGPAADAARKPGASRPIGSAPAARETPAAPPLPPASPPAAPALSITGQPMPPAAPPAPPPAAPPAIDETLPPPTQRGKRLADWLGKTPAPAASAAPAEELPDWLTSLSAESAANDALTQQANAAAPAEELPDLLKGTPPTRSALATEPPVVAEPPAGPAAPAAVPEAVPAGQMSDWLKPLAPTSGAPASEPPAVAEPPASPAAVPAEQTPDWLKGLAPTGGAPAAEPPQAMAPPVAPDQPTTATLSEDLPDWLKAMAPSPAQTQAPAATPANVASEPVGPVASAPEVTPPAPDAPHPASGDSAGCCNTGGRPARLAEGPGAQRRANAIAGGTGARGQRSGHRAADCCNATGCRHASGRPAGLAASPGGRHPGSHASRAHARRDRDG